MLFDFLISMFGLAVRLGVVRCSQCVSDTEFLVQGFHKLRCELGSLVRNNLSGNVVKAENLSIVDVRNTFRIDVRGCREDMDLFTVMVNVHHYCIVPSNLRQSRDQIDAYRLPWAFGYVVGLKC
jgi:hypothetical protein